MTLPGLQPKQSRQVEGWIEDLCGTLCDPIIAFPSPWMEDIPENLKKQIPLERLIMNMKVMHEERGVPVGDCEVLAYMFPRTMESPMGYEWTHIYSYCFTKAMTFMKVKVPKNLRVDILSDYELHQLDDLKRFIWDKRVQHRKEKSRSERQADSQVENEKAEELKTEAVQPSFF